MGPLVEADEALVLRSRGGDREAFEELVRRTSRAVFARVYLETGDAGWAEDLVQETFLTAWRSIKSLNNPQAFRAWLISIAHTALLQAVRRESREKSRGSDEQLAALADGRPGPAESVELRDHREAVLAALRAMPAEYRLPLTMRYLGGADYQTIGRELALSNGSLRGLLNRGMAMLRAQMKETSEKKAEAL